MGRRNRPGRLIFVKMRGGLRVKFPNIPIAAAIVATFLTGLVTAAEPGGNIREGDVVFSSSPRGQGQAIIEATASRHTHCGVVVMKNGRLMVLEAVQPVGFTTLENFAAHSTPGTFMARRLKSPLAPDALDAARTWGEAQIGKNYDSHFRWDDERLYCSELVWKFFEKAGVRLCQPRKFQDYRLDHPSVMEVIDQRYGGIDKLPQDENVVAPSDLAASAVMVDVPGE